MYKIIFSVVLLAISISMSSCVYYKDMPKEWASEVSKIETCNAFSGRYELAGNNLNIRNNSEYNDLRYFQSTPIYGKNRIVLPNLSSINIEVTNATINIDFYADNELIYKNNFDAGSFECADNSLILTIKNQSASGTGADMYISSIVTMFMSNADEIFVKRKETNIGVVFLVPAVTGENIWFKLKRIKT